MWILFVLACLFMMIFSGPGGLIATVLFVLIYGGIWLLFPEFMVDPFGIHRRQWDREREEKERQLEEKREQWKKEGEYGLLCRDGKVPIDFNELFSTYYNRVKYNYSNQDNLKNLSRLYNNYRDASEHRGMCPEGTVFLTDRHEWMVRDAIIRGKIDEKW